MLARARGRGQRDAVYVWRGVDAAKIGDVEVGAVAVEVHHVVGPAGVVGGVQRLRQPGECCWAEDVQVQAVYLGGAAADQAAGHRAERHIGPAARAADHQQDAQAVAGGLRQGRVPGCPQVGADEDARGQRDRGVAARVAEQFPG